MALIKSPTRGALNKALNREPNGERRLPQPLTASLNPKHLRRLFRALLAHKLKGLRDDACEGLNPLFRWQASESSARTA